MIICIIKIAKKIFSVRTRLFIHLNNQYMDIISGYHIQPEIQQGVQYWVISLHNLAIY